MRFGERRSFGGGRRFGGGGSRFGEDRFNNEPKPIKIGEEYDVEIKETGSKGDGIARINNFVVFVNGAKLGEKLHVKITDVRDRFAIAEKSGEGSEPAVEAKPETSQEGETVSQDDEDESPESDGGEESEEKTDEE